MPYWIEGWIEVMRSPDPSSEHAWSGVIDLSRLIDVADADSERLFGLSKRCSSGQYEGTSLAANVGIPANPSEAVRRELDVIARHEAEYGPGECGGYTHATWALLRTHELLELPEDSEWKLVFDLARQLEQRFKPEYIRFVVWFNW